MKLYTLLVPLVVLAQAASCEPMMNAPISDYCTRYNRTVLTQAEKKQIQSLIPELRKRIQGNDLDYLCQCTGFKDPVCERRRKS